MKHRVEAEIRRYRAERERIELRREELRLEEEKAWERVYRALELQRLGEWHGDNQNDG